MLRNEGERLKKAVVCTPKKEYFRVEDLKKHNIIDFADPNKSCKQHDGLKKILKDADCEIIDIAELEGHPNSVFIRDASICTPHGYIKLRMGLPSRRGEEEWAAEILESLGVTCAGEIKSPGTVEGGDVILAGIVAFIGLTDRTNEEGAQQLSVLLKEMDYEIRTVRMTDAWLHLGGAMSMIGARRILCCQSVFPPNFFKDFEVVEVVEHKNNPSAGNVICVAENEVIANASENRDTIRVLESRSIQVHSIDLSEFAKGAGGPSCLILPVERG